MLHVEMRMGLNVVRAFNLSEPELRRQFLEPLLADRDFVYEGHEWSPRKLRITICEGPRLAPHQLSLGRGWQNAQRTAADVTEAILERARREATAAPATVAGDALTQRIIGRLSAGPVTLPEVVLLAAELTPGRAVSQQLAAAEAAVAALLAAGAAALELGGTGVEPERWSQQLLRPDAWLDRDQGVRLVTG